MPTSDGQAYAICYRGALTMKTGCLVMQASLSPLDFYFTEISKALEAGLYYVAINSCLSLPDICSALQSNEDALFRVEKRYVPWCKAHIEPLFSNFTAEDCWALRGGVVHWGRLFGHPKARYSRIVFMLPTGMVMHECISRNNGESNESVLQMDVIEFCMNIMRAARNWYLTAKNDPNVLKNVPALIQFRPTGLAPHFIGMPLIA